MKRLSIYELSNLFVSTKRPKSWTGACLYKSSNFIISKRGSFEGGEGGGGLQLLLFLHDCTLLISDHQKMSLLSTLNSSDMRIHEIIPLLQDKL